MPCHTHSTSDHTSIAYFRGRKLRGRTVKVPEAYEGTPCQLPQVLPLHILRLSTGIVTKSTDRVLPNEPAQMDSAVPDDPDCHELEAAEPVKVLEAVAIFDKVTVWGHDQVPAADDTFIKGIEEWIAFAEAIHCGSTIDEGKDNKNRLMK